MTRNRTLDHFGRVKLSKTLAIQLTLMDGKMCRLTRLRHLNPWWLLPTRLATCGRDLATEIKALLIYQPLWYRPYIVRQHADIRDAQYLPERENVHPSR